MTTDEPRFRLEFYPTNPKRPAAIWDFATRDGDWWRMVADFSRASVTMEEAHLMCAALNRKESGDEGVEGIASRIADRMFATIWDRDARDTLERLLIEFAAEIKRSASEP